MNKDAILKRKGELEQQREELLANLHAVSGALQDCDYWLKQIEEEEG